MSSPVPETLRALSAVVFAAALCASPSASAEPLAAERHGVALDDLPGPLPARLDTWLRANPPGDLRHVHRVVIGPPADPDTPITEGGLCAPQELLFDVLGSMAKAGPRAATGGHRGDARRDDRGKQTHVPVTHVVRVSLSLPPDLSACAWPASFEPTVVEAFPLSALRPAIRVSVGDRAALLDDPDHAFRRLFPAGVGAIDTIRRPGETTSLTPASAHARVNPASSHRRYGTPRVFHGEPFLAIEAPYARGEAIAHYPTRVGFHVYQSWRFFRGFVSRGCVTLRTGDIRELRDVLFAEARPIPVTIDVAPLPGPPHPHPLAEDFHFALKAFGPPDAPTFKVSGGLYVTEKIAAPPPQELVGVFFDTEAELMKRREIAGRPDDSGSSGRPTRL